MARNTLIAWCDDTLNFWIGCQEVHELERDHATGLLACVGCECDICYAKIMAFRKMGFNGQTHSTTGQLKVPFKPVVWGMPMNTPRWKTSPQTWNDIDRIQRDAAETGRRLAFVMSLADWAERHPQVAPWRNEMYDRVERCPDVDFLFLTKRPRGAKKIVPQSWLQRWPQNVWVGTSVGTQHSLDGELRADYLCELPAPVRFLSMEPLIRPVDPSRVLQGNMDNGINWVITGGETGSDHPETTSFGEHWTDFFPVPRPRIDADERWFTDIRDTCVPAGVAFFHKQSSGPLPGRGAKLEGRYWHQWPDTGLGPLGGVRIENGAEIIPLRGATTAIVGAHSVKEG